MWDLRRNLDLSRIPEQTTVVRFWYRDQPAEKSRYWLRLERPDADLCLVNPGFDVALEVETRLRTMIEVWLGDRDLRQAIDSGAITLRGPTKLIRAFPRWLLLSTFARDS